MDLGSLADWFGAFGTIAAVIVALWQSNKSRQPKLKLFAEYYTKENKWILMIENLSYAPVKLAVSYRDDKGYMQSKRLKIKGVEDDLDTYMEFVVLNTAHLKTNLPIKIHDMITQYDLKIEVSYRKNIIKIYKVWYFLFGKKILFKRIFRDCIGVDSYIMSHKDD